MVPPATLLETARRATLSEEGYKEGDLVLVKTPEQPPQFLEAKVIEVDLEQVLVEGESIFGWVDAKEVSKRQIN